jgi:hypothetical protein
MVIQFMFGGLEGVALFLSDRRDALLIALSTLWTGSSGVKL